MQSTVRNDVMCDDDDDVLFQRQLRFNVAPCSSQQTLAAVSCWNVTRLACPPVTMCFAQPAYLALGWAAAEVVVEHLTLL